MKSYDKGFVHGALAAGIPLIGALLFLIAVHYTFYT